MISTIKKNHSLTRTFATVLGLTLCAASYGCDEDPWREVEQDDDRADRSITQFTKLFIIGDSLSDTHRMGGGLIPYCPNSRRGYWNHRFTNGFLWIDYLMQDNPQLAHKVRNYAVGGSGVLERYAGMLVGKTAKQARDLVSQNPASDVANSMVVVWAGANDIKEAKKDKSSSAYGHRIFETLRDDTIEFLAGKGVDHFVLVGLPRIDLVPVGQRWSAGDRGWAEIAVNTFNADLEQYAKDNDYVYVDVAEKIGEVLDGQITSVNMTDLSNPCHDGVNCVEQVDIPGDYQDKRCEGKMFFDRVHPTTGAHCGIAKWMEQAISTQYEINGADQDLESCAGRAQTVKASWGANPTNHTEPRSKRFKVQTQRDPNNFVCQTSCLWAEHAGWAGEKGNIELPTGSTVGYCTCEGGDGPDDFCETYDGDSVTLKTYHDTFVRAGDLGEVNQTTVKGSWEHFTVECQPSGTVALKTAHGGYLRAFPWSGWYKVGQQTFVGTQEQFTPVYQAEGSWAFKTSGGRYLKADSNNTMKQQSYVGAWEKFVVGN
ncbi:MAG: SGNH/GDSL hydrolase family protein [Nannocystaceae bacterium]